MNNNEERKPKLTIGYFDVVADVEIDAKTFSLNEKSKNNEHWFSNVFNPKVSCPDGKSMFMRFASGYNDVQGKTIYARNKNETSLEVSFADRMNENILALVDEKSFVKVHVERQTVKDEETQKEYKTWVTKNYLDFFDGIAYLQTILEIGKTYKLRLQGVIKYGTYNGDVSRNFEIQQVYLLTNNEEEDKVQEYRLNFTQNVLITKDCYVDNLDNEENPEVVLNTKLLIKEKKEYKILPLKLLMRGNGDKAKSTVRKLLKYFEVPEDKVRRITLEGMFEVGYISTNLDVNDLPDEAKELLDMELYSIQEIQRMYAIKDRVDNLIIKRPKMKVKDGKIIVEMSDDEYLLSDLDIEQADIDEEITIGDDEDINDLLSEIDNL